MVILADWCGVCKAVAVLAFSHLTLDQIRDRALNENSWRKEVFLKARKVLTGEELPSFLPQEAGSSRFLGIRVPRTFKLANKSEAKRACGLAQEANLPRELLHHVEDLPDGRGGVEKAIIFTREGDATNAASGSGRAEPKFCFCLVFFECGRPPNMRCFLEQAASC